MRPKNGRKKSMVPQKRPAKALADNVIYSNKESYNPISLKVMNERDIESIDMYQDGDYDARKQKKITSQEQCSENLHRKSKKLCLENFILFRKQQYFHSNGINYFAKLSDEVILYIFHLLPKPTLLQCSVVCKRWRDLSNDGSLWKRYDFGRQIIKPCALEHLLLKGISILRLAMSDIKSPVFSDSFLRDSQWYCNLQYLDLSMVTISTPEIASILSLCVYLKKLSVENCEMDEDCCENIAQNRDLSVLNMSMCSGLTPLGLHTICVNCTKLEEWNLAWTNLTTHCLETFLPALPKGIQKLNLSGNRNTLDDMTLIKALNRCPNIIELDISDCSLLTEVSFEVLVKKCKKLQHLHSSRAYDIPTECNRLLKELKDFKSLEIFRTLTQNNLESLRANLSFVKINETVFSTIARPTTGVKRTSIWGIRTRD
ncbi:s-phase kinase-associated protein 2 [Nephila pilipes]|uniref:S-phase kinase-associated protein 2 n=1 Tax=Nephila pilipes TaxID=299642 RepID=A0A8X6TU51_NEPPI|nr:s-phase kinase-associated protein 2 [Nephila pilipes]